MFSRGVCRSKSCNPARLVLARRLLKSAQGILRVQRRRRGPVSAPPSRPLSPSSPPPSPSPRSRSTHGAGLLAHVRRAHRGRGTAVSDSMYVGCRVRAQARRTIGTGERRWRLRDETLLEGALSAGTPPRSRGTTARRASRIDLADARLELGALRCRRPPANRQTVSLCGQSVPPHRARRRRRGYSASRASR